MGERPMEFLAKLAAETPAEQPSKFKRLVDRDLDWICLKCVEKSPSRRYIGAAELADDLERWYKQCSATFAKPEMK